MKFKMLFLALFFSLSAYCQPVVFKVHKVFIDKNSATPNNSFVEIDVDKELFILNTEGLEKSYFKIVNTYFAPHDGYSTLTLQGGKNEVFTVVIYFDDREKNMRINFPDNVVYLTVFKY